MSDIELQPDVDEVLQAEEDNSPAVKVKHQGPMRTQALPTKAGATLTKAVGTTSVYLLRADHRRAKVTLISDAVMLIAFDKSSATQDDRMARWPANVPYVSTGAVELYVKAATGTANVSFLTELWATGEGTE